MRIRLYTLLVLFLISSFILKLTRTGELCANLRQNQYIQFDMIYLSLVVISLYLRKLNNFSRVMWLGQCNKAMWLIKLDLKIVV